MKIGIINSDPGRFGGASRITAELAINLAKLKNEVHFFSLNFPIQFEDIEPDLVYLHIIEPPQLLTIKEYNFQTTLISAIIDEHTKNAFNILNIHYSLPLGEVGLLLKRIYDIPYVISMHGTDVHTWGFDDRIKTIHQLILNEADYITTASSTFKNILYERYGIDKEKIEYIPSFISINDYKRKKKLELKGEIKLVHSSSYKDVKKPFILIDMMKKLVPKNNGIILYLIGIGPLIPDLKKEVNQLGLNENIVFLGPRSDLIDIFFECDFLVMSSINEGNPIVILEALATETIIISSNVGGIADIVEADCGFLYEFNRNLAESLAEGIMECTLSNNMDVLKQNCLLSSKKFDCRKIVPKYINVYRRVLNGN